MALNTFYRFLWICISLLGFISCSQDKKTVIEPHTLRAKSLGFSDAKKRMQTLDNLQTLDLGGSWEVDLFKSEDFATNPLVVHVQSSCFDEASRSYVTHDTFFNNQLSIPLIDTLPPSALLSTSKQSVNCQFQIILSETKTGATFVIPQSRNYEITDSTTFANLSLFANNSNQVVYEDIQNQPLPSAETYTLRCSDFSLSLPAKKGLVLWKDFLGQEAETQKNWNQSQQNCRLLTKNKNKTFLSTPFEIAFTPQPLEIIYKATLSFDVTQPFGQNTALSARMINHNNYSVKIKIDKSQKSSFLFQPAYIRSLNPSWSGAIHETSLTWVPNENIRLTPLNENEVEFSIPPSQEANWQLVLDGRFDCKGRIDAGIAINGPIQPLFSGVRYDFKSISEFAIQIQPQKWFPISSPQDFVNHTEDLRFFSLDISQALSPFSKDILSWFPRSTEELLQSISWTPSYDVCKAL